MKSLKGLFAVLMAMSCFLLKPNIANAQGQLWHAQSATFGLRVSDSHYVANMSCYYNWEPYSWSGTMGIIGYGKITVNNSYIRVYQGSTKLCDLDATPYISGSWWQDVTVTNTAVYSGYMWWDGSTTNGILNQQYVTVLSDFGTTAPNTFITNLLAAKYPHLNWSSVWTSAVLFYDYNLNQTLSAYSGNLTLEQDSLLLGVNLTYNAGGG